MSTSWHFQEPFTSPDTDYAHFVFVMPVNYLKSRINDLPQMVDIKFRHDTPALGMRAQALDPGNNLTRKPHPHVRRPFADVIHLQVLQILHCRLCKRYHSLVCHGTTSVRGVSLPRSGISRGLPPGPSYPVPPPA